MDKYEYRVKTEQMLEYMENKDYQKAMEIADTIDWRRVKSSSMLNTVSEIYEYNGEYQKSRDILFVAFDRSPGSRKIVYRLGMLALKINDPEEASDCYEEFVKLAPRDPNQYILKYKILRAQGAPLTEQIAALEEFKKAEYVEKWAYELAERYHEAGMTAECLEECDDLILWFSEGKYVYKAMELKMKYKPLTPLQQEKYDSRPGAAKKAPEEPAEEPEEETAEETTEEAVEETVEAAEVPAEAEESVETEEAEEESAEEIEEEEAEEEPAEETEDDEAEEEPEKEKHSAITQVVKGATLEEALATGMALASGIHIEKEAMEKKEEDLRATSQMRIDDILQEWEEKQKEHAEAIEEQKAKDEERLQKEREEAMRRCRENLEILREKIYENGFDDMMFCPETMGKKRQIGTVEEIAEFCKIDKIYIPCVDFGHINAREGGVLKSAGDFKALLSYMIGELGFDKMERFHTHFSKIQYGAGGEIRHLTFEDEEYGPDYRDFLQAVKELGLQPYIICESAGTQAEDAVKMKEYYEKN